MFKKEFTITYDLKNGSSDDYKDLDEALMKIGAIRFLESCWYLKINSEIEDIEAYIHKFFDIGDKYFIAEIIKHKIIKVIR